MSVSVCRQNSVRAIMSVLVDISFCNIKHNNIWHWIKVYLDLGYFNFTRIQTRGPNVQKLMILLFLHEEFIWSVYAYHLYTFFVLVYFVVQKLLTLPEHMSSPPGFSEVCVTRSLVLCVMFCRSLFVLLSFFL